jgi:hypothetical protein
MKTGITNEQLPNQLASANRPAAASVFTILVGLSVHYCTLRDMYVSECAIPALPVPIL